jgi:hypothetical protein
MRKIDKLKNIQRANILAEQRYLKTKGLLTENDQQLIESILSSNNLNENENFDKLKDKLKQAAKAGILTTVIITKLLGPAYGLNPDQKSQIEDIAKKANIELSADDQITPDVNEPYKTIIKTLEKDGKIKSVNKPWGQFNDDTQFKTFSAVGQTEAAAKSTAMQTAIINGASTTDLQMSGQITIELTNGNIKVVYLIHKEKPQPKNLDDKQNLGDKIKSQTQKIGGDIKSTTSKITGDIKNVFKK